ncbi:hypothetical protein C4Q31_16270 [Leptospira borgpetersenii serovar Ceylonica]|nr:hypothetical protein C4Q31_16270 [Leptospira borgpetersenii serovar Ceylonica]
MALGKLNVSLLLALDGILLFLENILRIHDDHKSNNRPRKLKIESLRLKILFDTPKLRDFPRSKNFILTVLTSFYGKQPIISMNLHIF